MLMMHIIYTSDKVKSVDTGHSVTCGFSDMFYTQIADMHFEGKSFYDCSREIERNMEK